MKYIKIFFASSIVEFRHYRFELGDYIRTLNDIYVEKGLYFKLILCEDYSNALAENRKQDELNREVSDSQFFYILIGEKAGKASLEEFDVALKHNRESGSPRIYTFFLQTPDGKAPEQSTLDFMARLDKNLGHYYTLCENLDEIKLNILIELTKNEISGSQITIEGGTATIEGTRVLSLENVSAYSKHEELRQKQKEKEELDAQFFSLQEEHFKHPEDPDLYASFLSVAKKREAVASIIHQIENDILSLCTTLQSFNDEGRSVTKREIEAGKLLSVGESKKALLILQDEERLNDLKQAETIVSTGLSRIQGYISENRLLIQVLKTQGITEESIPSIQERFEENIAIAERFNTCYDEYYNYAVFLMDHNQLQKAVTMLEQSMAVASKAGFSQEQISDTEYLLACLLYKLNQTDRAMELHKSALSRRNDLAQSGDLRAKSKAASSCNQIGYLFYRLHDYKEARLYLDQAICVQNELIADGNTSYALRSALALSLNNLAQVAQKEGNLNSADELQIKAMKIREDLAKTNTVDALGFLAMSYLNYARLLAERKQDSSAIEAYFHRAINLYSELSRIDTKHVIDEAIAKYYYAVFLASYDKKKSLEMHLDAYRTRKALASTNPQALEADLAKSNYAIANLLIEDDRTAAIPYFKEALSIQEKLYELSPEKYGELYSKIKELESKIMQC